LKEIHHRVKNNLQVVNSLLSLRSEAIREPQARQVFVDCQNSVRSIALIHEKLYQSRNLAHIQADEYIPNLINHLQVTFSHQYYVHLDVQVDSGALDLDTAIPCGLIITELFTNAMKHAFVGREHSPHDVCRLWVEFRVQEGRGSLVIRDNGIGLPEDFDLTRSASLGLQLVALLTQQLRGQLTVTQAGGARFAIEFPLLTPAR
jgi:two-component sensor histidine kinase